MGEVFAAARNVMAWLGEPSDDSDEAIQFVSILYSAVEELLISRKSITEESLTEWPLCEYTSPRWTALGNFVVRPWFYRI